MNKEEALKVIRSGQTRVWNGYRNDNPDWKPDLSYVDLSACRLKQLDSTSFDFSEANLCGTKFSQDWAYMTRAIKNAKFNDDTEFPLFFDPYEYGAKFVTKNDRITKEAGILNNAKGLIHKITESRESVFPKKISNTKKKEEKAAIRKISKTTIGIIIGIIAIAVTIILWANPPPYYFKTPVPTMMPTSTLYTPTVAPTPLPTVVTVKELSTGSLFNGELLITVNEILYAYGVVSATIGSPGYQNLLIEQKKVGYVTTYNGSDTFEIRITKIEIPYAQFMVRRIE